MVGHLETSNFYYPKVCSNKTDFLTLSHKGAHVSLQLSESVYYSFGRSVRSCTILGDPVDCSPPGSSMGFPKQEYWSGLPLPFPADLPDPGIKPESPNGSCIAGEIFTTEQPGKPMLFLGFCFAPDW